ncbi:YecA family protein [Oryzisolibacter propanilivorax]|nr:YecA family protein [Oryzisolibacter propanilivorax]
MTEAASTPSSSTFGPAELDELDALLDDLRTRDELVPHWEFCDGALTALVCSRRPIGPHEWLPVLIADTDAVLAPDEPLPLLPPFQDLAQQQRFVQLWQQRWDQVQAQLAEEPEALDADDAFQPEVIDMRGAIAGLPEEERAEMEGEEVPAFGQIWAAGFLFVADGWSDDWEPPRDKDTAEWIADSLQTIEDLAEDDKGEPVLCMYDEDGPPSTSQERLETFGEAIWAVYDLYRIWHSLGPRVEQRISAGQPGRNDPCPCGSGKKFKKCCGA